MDRLVGHQAQTKDLDKAVAEIDRSRTSYAGPALMKQLRSVHLTLMGLPAAGFERGISAI
jgi:hypothetical protein